MKAAMLAAGIAVLIVITCWVVFISPSATDGVPADAPDPVLEARLRATINRTAHKMQTLNEVRAGQLTLWEAAEVFRDLHANDQTGLDQVRSMHPGCGDKELFCRWVIIFARGEDDGHEWEPVVARLEQELEFYRERGFFGAPGEGRTAEPTTPAGRP
jgi:hypothetical protein